MPVPISELFITVGADVSGALSGLNSVSSKLTSTAQSLNRAGSEMSKAITAPIVGAGAVIGLVGADFEHAFTGVAKTVDLTGAPLEDFRQQLVAFSTTDLAGGKSAEELANIAEVAGALGIQGADDLLGFTKAAAGLSVTTGIAANEIAASLGRVAVLVGTQGTEGFNKLGSAITALGNEMPGTERDIIEITTRMAGALSALGTTAPDILAVASAASAVGVMPEAAGTSIQRFFLDMNSAISGTSQVTPEAAAKMQTLQDRITDLGSSLQNAQAQQQQFGRNTPVSQVQSTTDAISKYQRELGQAQAELSKMQQASGAGGESLQNFASVAGVTTDQFKALFAESPAKAFLAIVQGLARMNAADPGSGLNTGLEKLGVTEQRTTQLLLSLVKGLGGPAGLDKALDVSNKGFEEGTAQNIEVAKAMQDTENQFALLTNQLKAQAIAVWPTLRAAMFEVMSLVRDQVLPFILKLRAQWDALEPSVRRNALIFLALAAAIGPALFILGAFVGAIAALANPIVIAIALIGLLATAWATNWNGIRDKVGGAIQTIAGLLQGDFGGALKLAMVAAIVAAALIGRAIGGLIVQFAALATTWLLNAAKIAAGWILAAGPAALFILAILSVITVIDLLRHAWDSNLGDIQGKAAAIAEMLKGLAQIRLNLALTPEARAGAQQDIDNLQTFIDLAKQGAAVSPPAPLLDMGENFVKQFDKGFPQIQGSIRDAFSGALGAGGPTLANLGVPADALANASLTAAGGANPTIPEGLARVGAFATAAPTAQVTINNPVVLDQAMLDQMTTQASEFVSQAMIMSEQMAAVTPAPASLPGAV